MYRLLFSSSLVLFYLGSLAQDDSLLIRKIADEVLTSGKIYDNLHTLTKTVGGRINGSPQTYKAEAWAQKALQEAGAERVYLQQCAIPHWVRGGKAEVKMIVNNKETALNALALGNSVGTSSAGINASVILINSFAELEQRKNEIKGKIVFYNYKFNPKFIQTFRAYGDAVRYRGGGASRAAQYGAVGMLVRSMTESTDNNPHTGAMTYNDSFPKIPALAIGLWDADKLAWAIQQNKSVHIFIKSNAHTLPDTVGYNVIGEITGSEFADQFITVGGHLDSWDPAEGAEDDGAGCVHSIEVLRVLKAVGYKPRHTLRIVLFTDEENRGSGAAKYVSEARAKNEKHVFALESDAGGFTPRSFGVSLSNERLEKLRSWIPLLQEYGVYEFSLGGGGADVTPLNEILGTPVGELIPDSQRYFDYHHAPSDVFENINKRELELGAINMAALIYLVDKYGL
ncbi:MAG TPA: M20/M25/M40 family metallo-hydrolase [Puia sp.]|nr:M20/M25/M40 family metallo-hydrolase [Puia sp.]